MTGIDPRGPRFGAGVTAVLLLVVVALALNSSGATLLARAAAPAFLLFAAITILFAWGVVAPRRHPYARLFTTVVRPRLGPPSELEDPAPPRFAQGVGFVITLAGLALELAGVPLALLVAGSAAFIAAFLNSVFGYCLGCQIYLLLVRAGLLKRKGAPAPQRA